MVLGKDVMGEYGLLLDRDASQFIVLFLDSKEENNVGFDKIIWQGFSKGYSANLDASLPVSFFAAGFRFGHSLLPSTVEQWSVTHRHTCKWIKILYYIIHNNSLSQSFSLINYPNFLFILASKRLSEMLNRPFELYQGGILDRYLAGFMNQVSQAVDDAVTEEVGFFLFSSFLIKTNQFPNLLSEF